MKKIYLALICTSGFFVGIGQTFQASIRPGTQANSVILSIKPSANVSASKLSSISLAIGVPVSASPKPVASIKNNFNTNMAYTYLEAGAPENVAGKGSYNTYIFLGDGAQISGAERNYTAGVDNDVIEVTFSGGPIGSVYNLLLLNIPDGGSTAQANFYIANQGTDVTNLSNMFYGTGATNGGGGYSGTSFVEVGNIALPVKFLSFYAIKNGDNAKLSWSVENDENNKQFDIERSTDGRNFKPHATVAAKANGKSTNTYEVADYNLSKVGAPVIYYRIKQVDKNGEIAFSNIRNLNADRNGVPASIFPNPAKSSTRLLLDAAAAGKASVVIRDMHGKMVKQVNFQMVQGVNQQDIHIAELSSGEYSVSVIGENFNHQLKLTKIR